MSIEVRKAIGYWSMLLLGIAILVMQLNKYFNNELELNVSELTVSVVGIVMILNPLSIVDLFRKVINTKYGKDNDRA